MIVIGVDAHKRSQTLVALERATGGLQGQRMVPATDAGALEALRFGQELDEERVWAIEDCRHVSGRFERALIAAGERVIRIPPALTSGARRAGRVPGKSDPIDAASVARAALREGVESFPAAFLDERAMDIRLLCDYRSQLISERVRLINRLRWHLLAIEPALEAQLSPAALDGPRIRARLARQLRRQPHSTQVRIAKAMLSRICEISRQERELKAELTTLIQQHCPQLLAQPGCGTITAAILIGHTAGAQRFPTDAAFAQPARATPAATDYTEAGTANSTAPSTSSPSPEPAPTQQPVPISTAKPVKGKPNAKPSAASNDTSRATSGTSSTPNPHPNHHQSERVPLSPLSLPPRSCPALAKAATSETHLMP